MIEYILYLPGCIKHDEMVIFSNSLLKVLFRILECVRAFLMSRTKRNKTQAEKYN